MTPGQGLTLRVAGWKRGSFKLAIKRVDNALTEAGSILMITTQSHYSKASPHVR